MAPTLLVWRQGDTHVHGCTGVAPQPRHACMIARTEAVSKEEMQLGRHLLLEL